jgi:hypothetical protein
MALDLQTPERARVMTAGTRSPTVLLDARGLPLAPSSPPRTGQPPVLDFQTALAMADACEAGGLRAFHAYWVIGGHGPGPLGAFDGAAYRSWLLSDEACAAREAAGMDGIGHTELAYTLMTRGQAHPIAASPPAH